MHTTILKDDGKKYGGKYVAIRSFKNNEVLCSGSDPTRVLTAQKESQKPRYFLCTQKRNGAYLLMPITDFPFLCLAPDNRPRPWLPVKITNPHTGLSMATYGLIDTGADECTMPAYIAAQLGHDL